MYLLQSSPAVMVMFAQGGVICICTYLQSNFLKVAENHCKLIESYCRGSLLRGQDVMEVYELQADEDLQIETFCTLLKLILRLKLINFHCIFSNLIRILTVSAGWCS